jgi:hypothetical protein
LRFLVLLFSLKNKSQYFVKTAYVLLIYLEKKKMKCTDTHILKESGLTAARFKPFPWVVVVESNLASCAFKAPPGKLCN